jgi:hypothetical protein
VAYISLGTEEGSDVRYWTKRTCLFAPLLLTQSGHAFQTQWPAVSVPPVWLRCTQNGSIQRKVKI